MSNHIAYKFFTFVFPPIPNDEFSTKIPSLSEQLRTFFPRFETPGVNAIVVNASQKNISTQQNDLGQQLNMIDPDGIWGIKLGNTALLFSVATYVPYDECIKFLREIIDVVVNILKITYFSRVEMRNLNLFELENDGTDSFIDIKDAEYWGRQSFRSLEEEFLCSGASTRHVYVSKDQLSQINLTSGVVLKGQSPVPQRDWDIWKLRGSIPVNENKEPQLVIEIEAIGFLSPVNTPNKNNNVKQYSWDLAKETFNRIHDSVEKVYKDIAKD